MRLNLLERLNAERAARRALVVETHLQSGAQRIVTQDEAAGDRHGEAISSALRTGRSATIETEEGTLFLNVHLPAPRIVVVGAVHISQALAPMARLAGYEIEIIDPRTAFATPERFAGVRIRAEWPDIVLKERPLDPYCALVAVTHDPKIDDLPLAEALDAGCFYVGALGSRRTHAGRIERLRAAGLPETAIKRIDAPIGADIGAVTPGEIAIAILASVIEAFRKRPMTDRRPGAARANAPVCALVLAAGRSSRMGGPNKLLALFDGEPLVRRTVRTALASRASRVVVVTGHQSPEIAEALAGLTVELVDNPRFADGLSTSLSIGFPAAARGAKSVLVLLADQPELKADHLDLLIDAFDPSEAPIVAASSGGKRGNPVVLSVDLAREVACLTGDVGARDILRRHGERVRLVEIGPAALFDVDTSDDLERAGGTPAP